MANSKPLPPVPSSAAPVVDRLAARQAALKEARARYAALRKVHRAIAADLASFDDAKTARLVKRALRNVKVWESGGIASPYYVRAWRRILIDPANSIPKMLRGHNANALVQNSPFGFIYREPKYRKELQHAVASLEIQTAWAHAFQ
ncbi:hypothetical protein [Stenotrophomonas sp.]|uniref:hypothetical protein n=1 Tax=Stenotrophomonas sp. TaxID=69392 RepID=UPI00289932D4|nr:hypothetical protein [Stenotrophomonas sp.]